MPSECFYHVSNRIGGRIFCFVGGFIDCAGYILLRNVFVASVTGNIDKFSISAARNQFFLIMIVVTITYGFGAATARGTTIFFQSRKGSDDLWTGIFLLNMELITLLIAMMVGHTLRSNILDDNNINHWPTTLSACLLSFPTGIQVSHSNFCEEGLTHYYIKRWGLRQQSLLVFPIQQE